MAGETPFVKIKRIVEQEKHKKVQGEARLSSLNDEKQRIFSQIKEELGRPVNSIADVEQICSTLKTEIEESITKMVELLRSEGIEV